MEAKKEETGKNTAIENIFARKSVRTYTPQPIEKEKVELQYMIFRKPDTIRNEKKS